eukprot:7668737-Pyramimonas_sp.AAC.1
MSYLFVPPRKPHIVSALSLQQHIAEILRRAVPGPTECMAPGPEPLCRQLRVAPFDLLSLRVAW